MLIRIGPVQYPVAPDESLCNKYRNILIRIKHYVPIYVHDRMAFIYPNLQTGLKRKEQLYER